MNWSDLKETIGGAAPLVGTLLGGPAGGVVGGLVAKALGVEASPGAVAQALQADPEAALKLRTLELTHEAEMERLLVQQAGNELAAETARIESVNATMRAEAASDKWWVSAWRPFWGFTSAVAFFVAVVFIFVLAWQAIWNRDAEVWNAIPELVSALSMLFAIPGAILGIASWHRGRERRIRAGERAGGTAAAFAGLAGGAAGKLFTKGGR